MKAIERLVLLLFLISVSVAGFSQEVYFEVTNNNGAAFRQRPYYKSEIISNIPKGRKVRLIQDSVDVVNTKSAAGVILKVVYFGQTGYILSTDINYKPSGINISNKVDALDVNFAPVRFQVNKKQLSNKKSESIQKQENEPALDQKTNSINAVRITAKKGMNVRQTSSSKSKIIGTVSYNQTVKVLSQNQLEVRIAGRSGYMLEIDYQGSKGYIFSGFTEPLGVMNIAEEKIDTLYLVSITSRNRLNIRAQAKPNSRVIGNIPPSTIVAVIDDSAPEIKISGKSGKMLKIWNGKQMGYIFSAFTKKQKGTEKKRTTSNKQAALEEAEAAFKAQLGDLDTIYFVKIVPKRGLNLREKSNPRSKILSTIGFGKIVPVYNKAAISVKIGGKRGQMIYVSDDSTFGYLFSAYTNIYAPVDKGTIDTMYLVKIKADNGLNMRNSEDPKSNIIKSLANNQEVAVVRESSTTIKIGGQQGKMLMVFDGQEIGYVFSAYTRKVKWTPESTDKKVLTPPDPPIDPILDQIVDTVEITTSNGLKLRTSKEADSKVKYVIRKGEKVFVLGPKGSSLERYYSQKPGRMIAVMVNGKKGFVSSSYVKKQATPIQIQKLYEVQVSSSRNLNLRVTSNPKSGVITSIPRTKKMSVLDDSEPIIKLGGQKGKMLKVSYNNYVGYVFSAYTSKVPGTESSKEKIIKEEVSPINFEAEKIPTQTKKDIKKDQRDSVEIKHEEVDSSEQKELETKSIEVEKAPSKPTKVKEQEKEEVKEIEAEIQPAIIEETTPIAEEEVKEVTNIMDTLYIAKITSGSSLNLRSSKEPNSKVVKKLPSLSDVAVLQESSEKLYIAGKEGYMLKVTDGDAVGYIYSPYTIKYQDLQNDPSTFDTAYLAKISSQNKLNVRITSDPTSAVIKAIEPQSQIAIIDESEPQIRIAGRNGKMIKMYDGSTVGYVFSVFTEKIPTLQKEEAKKEEILKLKNRPAKEIVREKKEKKENLKPNSIRKQEEKQESSNAKPKRTEPAIDPNIGYTDPEKIKNVRPSLKNRIDDEILEVVKLPYEEFKEELNKELKEYEERQAKANTQNQFNKVDNKFQYITGSGVKLYEDANFKSAWISKLKIGMQVEVLEKNIGPMIRNDGKSGRFLHINVNGQKGYIFDQNAAKISLPYGFETVKAYKINQYEDQNLKMEINKYKIPKDYIENDEILVLPTTDIKYAYLICQILYGIPSELVIPNEITEDQKIINNPNKHKDLLFDNIHIKMDKENIESITYNKKGFKVNESLFIRMNFNHVRVHFIEQNPK